MTLCCSFRDHLKIQSNDTLMEFKNDLELLIMYINDNNLEGYQIMIQKEWFNRFNIDQEYDGLLCYYAENGIRIDENMKSCCCHEAKQNIIYSINQIILFIDNI